MTREEFRTLSLIVGETLRVKFPGLTFAVAMTDGLHHNLASNAPTDHDVVQLLTDAAEQVLGQAAGKMPS